MLLDADQSSSATDLENAAAICLVQYDDRRNETALEPARAHNRRLCLLGAACSYITESDTLLAPLSNVSMPVYWLKVAAVQRVLHSGRCRVVVYLDSDAVVHDMPNASADSVSQLTSLLSGNHSMFISPNPPCWDYLLPSRMPQFCAGVYGIRASEAGLQLIDEWMRLYPSQMWAKANGTDTSWQCRACDWGQHGYEQGAFSSRMVLKYHHAIRFVSACQLNIPCISRAEANLRGAITCHFMGWSKVVLSRYLGSSLDGNPVRPTGSRPARHRSLAYLCHADAKVAGQALACKCMSSSRSAYSSCNTTKWLKLS